MPFELVDGLAGEVFAPEPADGEFSPPEDPAPLAPAPTDDEGEPRLSLYALGPVRKPPLEEAAEPEPAPPAWPPVAESDFPVAAAPPPVPPDWPLTVSRALGTRV